MVRKPGSSDSRPDPPERGWVPSPGNWTAPERKRAGKDWIPQGGAVERLDRMPWWVRAWSRSPLRALRSFEEWLWDHGGYDVEGSDAVLERERLSALYKIQDGVIRAALDHPGPWPAQSTVRTHNVEIVDVDRYEGLAVVTAAIAEDPHGDGPMVSANVFRWEEGTWRGLGGGGSGSGRDPLLARQEWRDGDRVIRVASKGWHGPREKGGPKPTCDATVWCAPGVSAVTVDRPGKRRVVDVFSGPGLLGIVWPEGSEPRVSAFDADGTQVAVLEPDNLRYDAPSRASYPRVLTRFWLPWRRGSGGRGWFNYGPSTFRR